MNPVLLYFISGESLYFGTALILVAVASSWFTRNRAALLIRNVGAWTALIFIVMAAAPFSVFEVLAFFLCFGFWYIAWNRTARGIHTKAASAILVATLSVVASVHEYPHRRLMPANLPTGSTIAVIGDSASAGLNHLIQPWPALLQQSLGTPVKNLSRAGATTTDGISMADELKPADRLVVLEIGGNDLIAGRPSAEFERSLDTLLSKVARNRSIVMFELPLLPDRIGYGRAQRKLANKYGVLLIPKRYFVDVLGGSNATSDGIHLSQQGNERMMKLMLEVLSKSNGTKFTNAALFIPANPSIV